MDTSCANCESLFEVKAGSKGYYRFSLERVLPGSEGSAKEVLKNITDSSFTPAKSSRDSSSFLCPKCWALLVNVNKYKQSLSNFWGRTCQSGYLGKKIPSAPTREQLPSTSAETEKQTVGARKTLFSRRQSTSTKTAKWESIASDVRNRNYRRAISRLYHATPSTKKHFHKFVKTLIRKEVKKLLKCSFPLTSSVSLPSLEDFSWDSIFERLSEIAPLIETALKGIATTPSNEDSLTRGTGRKTNLKPFIGSALSGLLFSRAPKSCTFLQTVYSIQLWRGGLKRESIDQLSHTGLCLGNKGTLSAIDKLRAEFDTAAKKCKEDLERQLNEDVNPLPIEDAEVNRELALAMSATKNIELELTSDDNGDDEDIAFSDSDAGVESSDDSIDHESDTFAMDTEEDEDGDDDMEVVDDDEWTDMDMERGLSPLTPQGSLEALHPGFTFCWDNVGKKVTTRHPTADTANTYINFALAYMGVNRIASTHLDVTGSDTIPAGDVPIESFIPSNEHFHEVRQRMNVVVSRILTQHLGGSYMDEACKKVTSRVWHQMNVDALKVESTGDDDLSLYCCTEELDEDFIGCEKRGQCLKGQWFHYSCADVDPENLPNEWYCSEECRDNTEAPYALCYCSRNLGDDEPMIGCSAELKCTQKEWYHWQCVGITAATVPKGDWFCCEACKDTKPKRGKRKSKKQKTQENASTSRADHKFKYNMAILWSGLNLLCRRDAVREGDGDAIVSHWVIDLIQFYRRRHVKYVILAHRLIASLNGWLPEKLRHDLRWNRTINYSGGMGRNLPADLMNELLNRLFKDLLKECRGHYTSKTLARCSQLVGPLGEAMDEVVDSKIMENEVYRHRRRAVNRDKNVALIVKQLRKENLFRIKPGRSYVSFPCYSHDETPRNAGSFTTKMKELSRRLDAARGIALDS